MQTFDEAAQGYVEAVQKMDALVLRCLPLLNDGDRDAYYLHDEYAFKSGELLAQDLVLNNPYDAPFYGFRLNLYLSSRLLDLTATNNSELTYRPDDWTPVNDWILSAVKAASCTFSIRTSRGDYSSAPMTIAHAFSTRHGVPSFSYPMPVSSYVGGLDFHRLFPIPRGEAMTVKVAPTFTRALIAGGLFEDLTSVPEYRVTAVLQGYKNARAFK